MFSSGDLSGEATCELGCAGRESSACEEEEGAVQTESWCFLVRGKVGLPEGSEGGYKWNTVRCGETILLSCRKWRRPDNW